MVRRSENDPIPAHEAMLRAAFLRHAGAIEAWNEWKPGVHEWDHLDLLSFRLMPQLYYNMRDRGHEDPHMKLLKGVCRKTWYNNQAYLTQVTNPLRLLAEHDIRTMLLFGGALTVTHYPDYALFPAVDFSVGVQASQVEDAIVRLQADGWQTNPAIPPAQIHSYVTSHHAHMLRHTSGRRLMLHWHALPQLCGSDLERSLWDEAEKSDLHGVPVWVPSPTNHFLLLCGQYSSVQGASLFMRAMDVMMLLQASGERIDWELLLARTREHRLTLVVRDTLEYVRQRLDPAIPDVFFRDLQATRIPFAERVEQRLATQPETWLSRAALIWLFYSRRRKGNVLTKLTGFPEFLKRRWRLRSRRSIPTFAARASWELLGSSPRKSKV